MPEGLDSIVSLLGKVAGVAGIRRVVNGHFAGISRADYLAGKSSL